jgi:hypothetical protein
MKQRSNALPWRISAVGIRAEGHACPCGGGRYWGTLDPALKMSFFVEGFFFDLLSATSLASAARLSFSHKHILLG